MPCLLELGVASEIIVVVDVAVVAAAVVMDLMVVVIWGVGGWSSLLYL